MGIVSKLLHPNSARELARTIALGAAGLVAGTWFIAWLTQFKVFEDPQGQVSVVTAFFGWLIAETWFAWLSGIVAGFALGVWIDALLVRRAAKRWWHSVQAFTIRDAACLLADVKRRDFEKSDRAGAIANELRGYVNSGQVPTFLEFEFEREIDLENLRYEPPYDRKDVGFDAVISKRTVEGMARGRKWPLPWPIPPKSDREDNRPFPRPKREPQGLAALLPTSGITNYLGTLAGEKKAVASRLPAIETSHPRVLAEAKAIDRQLQDRLNHVSAVLERDDQPELEKWLSKIGHQRVDYRDLDRDPMNALTDKERELVRVAVRTLADLDRHVDQINAEPGKFGAGHAAGMYRHRADKARIVISELIETMEAEE